MRICHGVCRRIRSATALGVCLMMLALRPASVVQAEELVPITVQLDWKPGVQFAGLLVAQERGWYRDAGLAVTIRANDFRRPYVDVVAEDDHTVGTSEARTLVNARARGLPIRAVATMFQASPIVLISLKSHGLEILDDLGGKALGIHRLEDQRMLQSVLGTRFFTPRQVGFDCKELLSGEVDAAPGYLMDEPLRLAQNGTEVNVLSLAENGLVDYAQVLFVNEAFLARDPAALKRFLVATFRGWRAALADPEATATSLYRQYPGDLNQASLRQALDRLGPLLRAESPHFGVMKSATWQRIIDATHIETGRTVQPVTVENLVDFRYSPTLEKD